MVLNYIWIGFFLIAFLVAIIRTVGYYFRDSLVEIGLYFDAADFNVFQDIIQQMFFWAEKSVGISIYLIGIMTLWLGIMKIGENAGAVQGLARLFSPFFQKIFPDIPKNHPAYGSMMMNFSANMLGLDNAATPLGINAMKELQKENKEKTRASNAQIMFLVLNTSGLTLIPVTVIGYRAMYHATNPADVFIPILIATYCSTLIGLITVSLFQKINLFNKTVLLYLGTITLFIGLIIWYMSGLEKEKIASYSGLAGNMILFSIITLFILMAFRRKINVYDSFIEGAKKGFGIAIKIIPYLIAMLVAIGAFRASGAFDILIEGIANVLAVFGADPRIADALPTAFMKPLSGGGARGMMIETMDKFGADSFQGFLSSVFQGSTETTFYTLAVYFGAINVKNTRYTVTAGLIADFAGILAAIFIAIIVFGN
ncbi:MAG: hypothetical protein JXR58_05600 [Bacteroidales bacterium]|nr:hypothetical protein [Bacteroidales bacterium]